MFGRGLARGLRATPFSARSYAAAIDRSKLAVTTTTTPGTLPPLDTLVFGGSFGDHMLEIDWDATEGWSAPVIKPMQDLRLHPATSALHYAIQCFEGAKVFKDDSGSLRSFRLDMNMKRLAGSMERSGMPALSADDQKTMIDLIHDLVRKDEKFVPAEDGYSLYLRPTAIATQATLGVSPPTKCKLYVITSPVGPYYKTGFKPVSLLASDKYT